MPWNHLPAKPNILLLITDQQRFPQHWPAGWVDQHLPGMRRLLKHGMSFEKAFAAACECSPSRATFVTSTFDNTNQISTTPPPVNLPTALPNLATVLRQAGYQVAWKGKWHLFESAGATSLSAYGFDGWNPPDAGTTLGPTLLGGGTPGSGPMRNGNDHRFVHAKDGAVDFLMSHASAQPFCLVVSMVNPHDVHVYTQGWASVGYPPTIPDMGVCLPGNHEDSLLEKPRAQGLFRQNLDNFPGFQFDPPAVTPAGYVNFYAYLHTVVDQRICAVLDALDAAGLTERTLVVRMGDHGEMAMSHGLREKMYVAYDEAIHVPLIFSNPLAFTDPVTTDTLASLLDLAPTLAAVAGGASPVAGWMGKDLTPVLAGTQSSVQDAVLYAYDDSFNVSDFKVATHIRAVRTAGWLYDIYFSEADPSIPCEFELYDLDRDPGECVNLLSAQRYEPGILDRWRSLNTTLLEQAKALGALPPGGVALPASADLGPWLLHRAAARQVTVAEATTAPIVEGK